MDQLEERNNLTIRGAESDYAIESVYTNPHSNTFRQITNWITANETEMRNMPNRLDVLTAKNMFRGKANIDYAAVTWGFSDKCDDLTTLEHYNPEDTKALLDVEKNLDAFNLSDDDYIESSSASSVSTSNNNLGYKISPTRDSSGVFPKRTLKTTPKDNLHRANKTSKTSNHNNKLDKYKKSTEPNEDSQLPIAEDIDYDDDYCKKQEQDAKEKENLEYEIWAAFAAATFHEQADLLRSLHQYYIKYIADKEFIGFLKYYALPEEKRNFKVKLIKNQLFKVSSNFSIVHCVGKDFSNNGNDVSKHFGLLSRDKELCQKIWKTGDLAILNLPQGYVYYLIAKNEFDSLTTLYYLWSSLLKLRKHVELNTVTQLVMPESGGGIEIVLWPTLISMLEFVFHLTDVQIAITKSVQV